MPYHSSSFHESGGSLHHLGELSACYLYQELDYQPTFDYNQLTSKVIPSFNALTLRDNVNMMSDEFLADFLGPNNQGIINQGGNQDRSVGGGTKWKRK
jgi:hypothetical protein